MEDLSKLGKQPEPIVKFIKDINQVLDNMIRQIHSLAVTVGVRPEDFAKTFFEVGRTVDFTTEVNFKLQELLAEHKKTQQVAELLAEHTNQTIKEHNMDETPVGSTSDTQPDTQPDLTPAETTGQAAETPDEATAEPTAPAQG